MEVDYMSNSKAREILLLWLATEHRDLSYPTDGCSHAQHMQFVRYRTLHWHGGTSEEFRRFVREYADMLLDNGVQQ